MFAPYEPDIKFEPEPPMIPKRRVEQEIQIATD